jgi:hypothetical protein
VRSYCLGCCEEGITLIKKPLIKKAQLFYTHAPISILAIVTLLPSGRCIEMMKDKVVKMTGVDDAKHLFNIPVDHSYGDRKAAVRKAEKTVEKMYGREVM